MWGGKKKIKRFLCKRKKNVKNRNVKNNSKRINQYTQKFEVYFQKNSKNNNIRRHFIKKSIKKILEIEQNKISFVILHVIKVSEKSKL